MTSSRPPRILLIGTGRFGLEHLAEWKRIEALGEAELVAVMSRSRRRLPLSSVGKSPRVVHALSDQVLDEVDGVDIVTPAATHAELVRRCLPRAHVLVEKPLAMIGFEAEEIADLVRLHGRTLMVGHVFRFHPVVCEVQRVVGTLAGRPRRIEARMINPLGSRPRGADPSLELLHLYDIVDFLFDVEPEVITGHWRGELLRSSLRYPGPMTATFDLGWAGAEKIRDLRLVYEDRSVRADLVDDQVVIEGPGNQIAKHVFPGAPGGRGALFEELRAFAGALSQGRPADPDAEVGTRIVKIATAAAGVCRSSRPRIAVIGGGIFGATCAVELGSFGDVTLFERSKALMVGTSARNQRRHHTGFHYPRSFDTMVEIGEARADFETEYGEAIDWTAPAYYCTSATGVEIPAARYLAACDSGRLRFRFEEPPAGVVDSSRVSLSLRTDEGVYDVPKLREIVARRLSEGRVVTRLSTEVTGASLRGDGSKRLTVVGPDGERRQSFDYVINATYERRNELAHWLGFSVDPLRFDLCELLALQLPIPRVSVTVLDGPFSSLIGIGPDGRFLLSHIHDSVLRSEATPDGLPPRWPEQRSNRHSMLRHSSRYFPILDRADQLESWWVTRAVLPCAGDIDARRTVVTDHGFGCWSLLGGKVVTCVSNARKVAAAIVAECSLAERPTIV